ncbi:MAG TPA: hypothetical protein VIJ58_12580 [Candidatus Dormibacteraeota bacterium]
MLRQLATLTRRLPAAGPRALAVAVYSGSTGEHFEARERGVEGVACVDDAARACVLLCKLWAATGNDELRRWADGLLDFVLWMHAGDGRWHNFVYDWQGTRNTEGPTSAAGINFWQARAICALAEVKVHWDDDCARAILTGALATAASASPPSDVRAIHALGALVLLGRAPDPWLSEQLTAWCDELAECRRGGMLMNSPDERDRPHLWGHVQEAVLADASVALGRKDLLVLAVASAEAVFAEVIESGFDLPHVHSYDVQSAVFVMDRLAAVTGEPRYGELARKARSWFDGRNPAGAVIYDRAAGRVADGLDDGRLNDRSGAEANISAGLALLDDPVALSMAKSWSGAW